MMSSRLFQIESIDLAAFLTTSGYEPRIYRGQGSSRATFEFIETTGLHVAVIDYERGAVLPAKRLLNVRSRLFREASRVCREVLRGN